MERKIYQPKLGRSALIEYQANEENILVLYFNDHFINQKDLEKISDQIFEHSFLIHPTRVVINTNQLNNDLKWENIQNQSQQVLVNANQFPKWTWVIKIDWLKFDYRLFVLLITKWWQIVNILIFHFQWNQYKTKIILNQNAITLINYKHQIQIFWSDLFYDDVETITNYIEQLVLYQVEQISYFNIDHFDYRLLNLINQFNDNKIINDQFFNHHLLKYDQERQLLIYQQLNRAQTVVLTKIYHLICDPVTNLITI